MAPRRQLTLLEDGRAGGRWLEWAPFPRFPTKVLTCSAAWLFASAGVCCSHVY